MAAPSYLTDLSDIYTDTDNFVVVGGGRVTAAETDDYIQGNNCWSHDPFSSGIEGGMYDATSAPSITSGDAVFIWTKCDVAATLATHSAGGIQVIMGDSATAYDCFYVAGSDDYVYGGWKVYPVDPTKTPSTTVGSPATNDHFGVRWNVPSTGAAKGYPMKIDAIRYGKIIWIDNGDSGTPATWDATAAYDATTTRQWGLCQPTDAGAAIQGNIVFGFTNGAYSRDSNRTITVIDTEWTDTDFTKIIFGHASNDIEWDNVGVIALGTNNRGIIDVTANGTVKWENSVFQDIDVTNLDTNSTFDGSKWLSTNEVDAGGASMLGCSILTPTVAVDSYGLLWNVATNPSGKLDGMTFSKGTNAHHGIEFGLTSPTTISLNDMTFSGFGANDTTSSALNFLRTSGTVTVNLSGMATPTYKSAGADIVFVNAVTVKVTATDIDGDGVVGARVRMEADTLDSGSHTGSNGASVLTDSTKSWTTNEFDGYRIYNTSDKSSGLITANTATTITATLSGGTDNDWDTSEDYVISLLPADETIGITSASTTATVTHANHGLSTGDKVVIRGATQDEYNKIATITVTGTNAYTYTIDSGATSPATGTITSTAIILDDATTTGGVLQDIGVNYANDQPVRGVVRKGTSSPYYKTSQITGTITDAGYNQTILLISDE
jgi:hypothetical protein